MTETLRPHSPMWMFMAVLLTIAKRWKQPNAHPQITRYAQRGVSMPQFAAGRNEIRCMLLHGTTCKTSEDIEQNHIPLVWDAQSSQSYKDWRWPRIARVKTGLTACCGLNVCVLLKSLRWNLIPSWTVIRGGTFGVCLDYNSAFLMNGIVYLR